MLFEKKSLKHYFKRMNILENKFFKGVVKSKYF